MNRSQWRNLAAGAPPFPLAARLLLLLGLGLALAVPARAAQSIAGFPRKVGGNAPGQGPVPVGTPLVAQPGADGQGRVYFGAGSELHCLTLASADCDGFPRRLGDRVSIVGAPALGDVDGDRREEIALALSNGQLLLVRADGSTLPGFSFQSAAGFAAGPSLLPVEGGRLEVAVGTRDGRVHLLRASGAPRPGFPAAVGTGVTSPVAAALFGVSGKTALASGNEDGRVYLLDLAGRPLPGFPAVSSYLVSGEPALGDLDGDGYNDLAFASQDFKLYALRRDGKPFAGFPATVGARVLGGPALGDLDGDGATLELAVAASDGRLHAFTVAGKELKGFPVKLGEKLVGSALIADLDRDGQEELLATTADGQLHAVRANGKPFSGFPARLGAEAISGPVVVDVGDGTVVVQAAGDKVHAFRVRRTGKATAPLAWPEAGHDAARTGRVHPNWPGYADLTLTPAAPGTDEELSAAYRFYDLDGRAEPATEIRWFRDGKEVPELAGRRTVPKELTRKHERWRFQLSAPGARTRQSPEVVVVNSRPGKPKIGFFPAVMRRAEALQVRILSEAPDADGDRISYSYTWLKNGVSQPGLRKPELPAGTLKKGERWSVVVTARDGEAEGLPVSLEATVADSPPTAPEIALVPAQPRTGDPLKVIVKKPASDVDGDPLRYRYRYLVDGVALSLATSVDTLPPFSARKRQRITVEVQADDGELLGPVARAETTVVNTAPTAPAPAILPSGPRKGDTLVAGLAAPSLDPDGDRLSYRFAFARDGRKLADGREVGGLKKGEVYEAQAIASDGEADSPACKVAVTVGNTPPPPPGIAFESLPLRRSDPVKVKIVEPSIDADGDAVSYRYAWFKDGQPQPALSGASLPAGTVKKGERWKVVVTPLDGAAEGSPAALEATAVDSAPGAPEVVLSPVSPRIGDAVKAVIHKPATDVDGDRLAYRFRFFVDGVPVALPPAADTLPPGTARKRQTVTVEVRAFDGELAGPVAGARATVVNTPPSAPRAAIVPAQPQTRDSLFALLAEPAADADGDALSYRFSFFRDGRRVEAGADGREVRGLKKGETYELHVVANDGEADSPPAVARATVRNTPPTAPAVSFSNAAPQAGEAVAVKMERGSTDADGDAIAYAYTWLVNGKPAGLPKDAAAIPAGRVKKHEEWVVEVAPGDGQESGPATRARLVVVNTPPAAPVVAIEPAEPTAETGARARIVTAATDRDGDAIAYRYLWVRDGVRLELPPEAASVAPGVLRRGERLTVVVTPFDGEAEGASASASARVRNSPPVGPQIALLPARPTVRDELVCAVKVAPRDPDRETPQLRFAWKRDGEPIPVSASQDRLPAGVARHGEVWSCEAFATDGELVSATAQSEAKILNSPPGAARLVVEPDAPRAGQDLFCRLAAPAEDPDGDKVTYTFRWTENGRPLPASKEPWTLPASSGRKGASYRCEVVASDGAASGPTASAEGRYRNSPPTAPVIRLAPEVAVAGNPISCEILEPATDPDGDPLRYRYTWQKNGVDEPFAPPSAEVPGRLVKPGDMWRCAVVASDGADDGATAFTPQLVIQRPAPSAGR